MAKIKKDKRKKRTNNFLSPIVMLLAAAFILRIILASFGTLSLDQNTFVAWGRQLSIQGFRGFYSGWSDYLPGYLYVLWSLAKVETVFPFSTTLLYKLPAIIGDIAAGALVYKIAQKHAKKYALFAASLVLFNPALLANSTLWGQVDVLTALFSLAAIYFIPGSIWLSAIMLALGALIKPQAALAAPVVLFVLLKHQKSIPLWKIYVYILSAGSIFFAAFLPFMNGGTLWSFVGARLGQTLGQYPYGSVNAFNFWGLWGFWQQDTQGIPSPQIVGYLLFALTAMWGFIQTRKHTISRSFRLLAIFLLANFLFFTRMHERHLLPAIIALAPLVAFNPVFLLPLMLLSFTYVVNMRFSYVWIVENFATILTPPTIVVLIICNIIAFLLILYPSVIATIISKIKTKKLRDMGKGIYNFWTAKKPKYEIPDIVTKRQSKIILTGILVFALVTRLISLSHPSYEYFDEVYHAFTARQMLHGNPAAWEWWNDPPEGFAYEWTHPPFAKLAMVGGMRIFGENSFGWRVPAALFGTGTVFLLYLLTRKLFNSESIALLATTLFALDGLGLTLSRIGMNDIYLVFFMLLSVYLFLKNKLLFSSLALGFAAASKWTTLWFLPIFVCIAVLTRKKPNIKYLFFVVVPPLVYVANYIPQFLSGHSWDIFWGMQKQMWWYHTGLVATHPFSSSWWSWPLLLRPIWLYTGGVVGETTSNIYAMGNPIIFWGGFISILVALYYTVTDRSRALLIAIFAYVAVFIPWSVSPRIMFLYHYFPAVPFMCMALAYVLLRNKKLVIPFLVIAGIVFIYFYPRLTGIPVSPALNDSYYWLPSWR